MFNDSILPVILRWVHILAAILAVGGMIFMRMVLMPAAHEALTEEQHVALRERVMARWRRLVALSIGLLLLTGFYNFMTVSIPKAREVPSYHLLFAVKFILALVVFFLGSVLAGRSATFAPVRARARTWLTLNIVLALAVVLIAGILGRIGG